MRTCITSIVGFLCWMAVGCGSPASLQTSHQTGTKLATSPEENNRLIQQLGDQDHEEQKVARDALETMGVSALPELVATLNRQDYQANCYVQQVLEHIGEPAVEPLLKAAGSPNPQTRWTAIRALGNIADRRAVPVLIKALKDENGFVRRDAPEGLGRIGDRRAFDPLLVMMTDPQETFSEGHARYEAAIALEKLDDNRLVATMLGLLKGQGSDARSRWMAAMVLGNCGARGNEVVEVLLGAIRDHDDDVVVCAAEALGKIKDDRALQPLLNVFAARPRIRRHIAYPLAAFKKPVVTRTLLVAMDDEGQDYIIGALGVLGDREATMPLLKKLKSPSWEVRFSTACALASLADPRSVDALVEHVYDEGDKDVCDASVAEEVAKALVKIGPKSLKPLKAQAASSKVEVRAAIATVLGNFREREAIDILVGMLRDADLHVREQAVSSLAWLTGEQLGDDAAAWESWWRDHRGKWTPEIK